MVQTIDKLKSPTPQKSSNIEVTYLNFEIESFQEIKVTISIQPERRTSEHRSVFKFVLILTDPQKTRSEIENGKPTCR